MKKLFSFLFVAAFALSSCNQEDVTPTELNDSLSGPGSICFFSSTNPSDGNCPAQYDFSSGGGNSYLWVLSGDAHFITPTNQSSASVVPNRHLTNYGEFQISLFYNGSFMCEKIYTVLPENLCQ
jgi:hypothetical protein